MEDNAVAVVMFCKTMRNPSAQAVMKAYCSFCDSNIDDDRVSPKNTVIPMVVTRCLFKKAVQNPSILINVCFP